MRLSAYLDSVLADAGPPLLLPEPGEVGLSGHRLLQSLVGGISVTALQLLLQQGLGGKVKGQIIKPRGESLGKRLLQIRSVQC